MRLFQFWFPQCVCPAVGLLGHMTVLVPVFKGISTLFSIVAVLVCIPTCIVRGFLFIHTLSNIFFFFGRQFDSSHSDQPETVSNCGFDLYFSDNEWCWASFHVFVSHLYVFFGEMSIWFFGPFFDWVIYFPGIELLSCLYILRLMLCQMLHLLLFCPILKAVFSPCL